MLPKINTTPNNKPCLTPFNYDFCILKTKY